jgi:hypothetical protein
MFEPSEDQRRTVRALSGYGVPQEGIAIHIGIDAKTLRKHFRDELDRGSVEATAKVAQTLFHLATVEKNVAAVIFWMKARAGWREKSQVELSGPDGDPMRHMIVEDTRPSIQELLRQAIPEVRSNTYALGTST